MIQSHRHQNVTIHSSSSSASSHETVETSKPSESDTLTTRAGRSRTTRNTVRSRLRGTPANASELGGGRGAASRPSIVEWFRSMLTSRHRL